jgi:Protein of unknown function (DUF4254)
MTQKPGTQLAPLIDAHSIMALHDRSTEEWHRLPPPHVITAAPAEDFDIALRALHQANYELWHLEDEARSPYVLDREIAAVKRIIDRVNQRRNDLMERCDALLLETLSRHGLPILVAPLHSETPGLIVDRLSILALKIFHTREEAERADASPGHIRRNKERLQLLEEQRVDLAECLDRLWEQVIHGQRRFKLYRQLKMYNDPSLNPAIYRKPNS